MKRRINILVLLQFFVAGSVLAQSGLVVNDRAFDSVFADVVSGEFGATASGVLVVKTAEGRDVILDFQGSEAGLAIEQDPDAVYDVSRKKYTALTTSGKTAVEYDTYGYGNVLTVRWQDRSFGAGVIDGACDMIVDGLSWKYWAEAGAEYLVLTVEREIVLTARDGVRGEAIVLLPDSVIVCAVKR